MRGALESQFAWIVCKIEHAQDLALVVALTSGSAISR